MPEVLNNNSTSKLEKKIDDLGSEMKAMHLELVSMKAAMQVHDDRSVRNSQEIEVLKTEINTMKGGLSLFRVLGLALLTSFIAFVTWITSSVFEGQKHNEKILERMVHIEKDIISLEQVTFNRTGENK